MKYDILIVEDEDDIREMISGILADEGYEVRQSATSDEALVAVKARQPSLIVLDVWLKGCLLYTSPSPRDRTRSRMPSSA